MVARICHVGDVPRGPYRHDAVMALVGLAAAGLTNPKIAERMFIARGTVKVHLSHVFAKLAVTTRAELPAQATKRGLAET